MAMEIVEGVTEILKKASQFYPKQRLNLFEATRELQNFVNIQYQTLHGIGASISKIQAQINDKNSSKKNYIQAKQTLLFLKKYSRLPDNKDGSRDFFDSIYKPIIGLINKKKDLLQQKVKINLEYQKDRSDIFKSIQHQLSLAIVNQNIECINFKLQEFELKISQQCQSKIKLINQQIENLENNLKIKQMNYDLKQDSIHKNQIVLALLEQKKRQQLTQSHQLQKVNLQIQNDKHNLNAKLASRYSYQEKPTQSCTLCKIFSFFS